MQSEELIQTSIEQVRQIINQVDKLKKEELSSLQWRPSEPSWNILECIKHLNLYGDFYLPQIEQKIKNAAHQKEAEFKSGLLGNYFAQMMLPKEKLKKMKTFKSKNPLNTLLDKGVIDEFIHQQFQLLNLLNESREVSLSKIKIPTSISNLINLKLGDTFRFFINHMIRHINQMEKIQNEYKNRL